MAASDMLAETFATADELLLATMPEKVTKAAPTRIVVIGCGHVGLVMAAGFAELGHDVVGIDLNEALVDELRAGIVRIRETGLPELVAKGVASGRLAFDTRYAPAVSRAQFIFLAVDTPQTMAGAANLRNIRACDRARICPQRLEARGTHRDQFDDPARAVL